METVEEGAGVHGLAGEGLEAVDKDVVAVGAANEQIFFVG